MSVSVMRCFEYTVTCDRCGAWEIYHTGDEDRSVRVHTMRTAVRASGYRPGRKMNGVLLCPECQREEAGK